MENKQEVKDIILTEEEVELLNSKLGLRGLFRGKKIDVEKALRNVKYENELRHSQEELVKLQSWVIKNNEKVVILFEGRDSAGKGGAIRRITAHINPRFFRTVALDKPTESEKGQWYFQRYVSQLPKPGEIVFFDRSWYNRAVVEPVNGFCSKEEYDTFMAQVNDFEKMLTECNTHLVKLYFSISKEEQAKRFKEIRDSGLKRWKMSPVDEKAQELWDEYTKYRKAMHEKTDTAHAPWEVIKADKKTVARLAAINHVLKVIPYKYDEEETKVITY